MIPHEDKDDNYDDGDDDDADDDHVDCKCGATSGVGRTCFNSKCGTLTWINMQTCEVLSMKENHLPYHSWPSLEPCLIIFFGFHVMFFSGGRL